MQVRIAKLKVKVNGQEGYINEEKFFHYNNNTLLRKNSYSEFLWTQIDNRHSFISLSTGAILFSSLSTHESRPYISVGVLPAPENYNVPPWRGYKTVSEMAIDCDSSLLDWCTVYTPDKYEIFCNPMPDSVKKDYPDGTGISLTSLPDGRPKDEQKAFFKCEVIREISLPELKPSAPPFSVGLPEHLKLKNDTDMPQDKSERVFVSYEHVPVFMINEGNLKWRAQQVQYYTILRYQYWHRESLVKYELPRKETYKVKVSLRNTTTDHIEEHTNLDLKQDLGYSLNLGVGKVKFGSFSQKISRRLSEKRVIKSTQRVEKFREYEYEKEVVIKSPTRLAVWALIDSYEVVRPDGTILTSWDVSAGKRYFVEDKFPKEKSLSSDYVECEPEIEIIEKNNEGYITFSIYSSETDYHHGNFDYDVTLYNIYTGELESRSIGSNWGPSAGENPYILTDSIDLFDEYLIHDIEITSISGICFITDEKK